MKKALFAFPQTNSQAKRINLCINVLNEVVYAMFVIWWWRDKWLAATEKKN
jgi:hypothetical protein